MRERGRHRQPDTLGAERSDPWQLTCKEGEVGRVLYRFVLFILRRSLGYCVLGGGGRGGGDEGLALAGTPLGLGVNLHEKMAPSLDTV